MGSSTIQWNLRPVVKYHLRRGVGFMKFLENGSRPQPPTSPLPHQIERHRKYTFGVQVVFAVYLSIWCVHIWCAHMDHIWRVYSVIYLSTTPPNRETPQTQPAHATSTPYRIWIHSTSHIPLSMPHPQTPPNRDTQISQYKFKWNQNLIVNFVLWDTEESEFLDLVDFGSVAFSVKTAVILWFCAADFFEEKKKLRANGRWWAYSEN